MSRKIVLAALLAVLPAGAATACDDPLARLETAIGQADMAGVEKAVREIQTRADCSSGQIVNARRRSALAMLKEVNRRLVAKAGNDAVEPLLVKAQSLRAAWQVSDLLGELRQEQKRYREATVLHQEAIDLIRDEQLTPNPPPEEQIAAVFKRAETARLLASSYVPATTRSGEPGGLAAAEVRGWAPVAVAVPVTFEFDKTDFTENGRAAAADLARSLSEERPESIVLVGHTDVVGEDDYNMKLSIARAEALRDYLEKAFDESGARVRIEVRGEGETRPYETPIRASLSEEEAHQLDRRVELVRK